jgi:ubiquitin carboxyl-terminal hydrolase 16
MPDKQLTIATYAAGASLATIALVYVFAPTFFIDGDASASGRRRGVVGLLNTANDCFINSVLQALAGLGDLRIYLIRETHRRNLDGESVYLSLVEDPARKTLPEWKIEGLQRGIATQGLKDMLDALNERPLAKKTISPTPFIRVLEDSFRQRISRQQQDAQEFLQVVAERLCDEYHAGHRARRARDAAINVTDSSTLKPLDSRSMNEHPSQPEAEYSDGKSMTQNQDSLEDSLSHPVQNGEYVIKSSQQNDSPQLPFDDEEGFPFEGRSESQIECLTCGFKPKPSRSTFCTLTLNVPQVNNSTTLNACFDLMFKTEYIEDFKCEKCRLVHAVDTLEHEMRRSTSEKFKTTTQNNIESLAKAIEIDPETPPEDIQLPDSKFAPKRKIARHVKITKFPKILAIHLSRSIFDSGRTSMKNSAKVTFTETMTLGGLLDQRKYKLLAVVTHKGSHHSGHYESFRRQNTYPPFSNPNAFDKTGVYSKAGTPSISVAATPQLKAEQPSEPVSTPSTPELLSPTSPPTSSRGSLVSSTSSLHPAAASESSSQLPNGRSKSNPGPTSAPRDPSIKIVREEDSETSSLRSVARSARTSISKTLSRTSTPKVTKEDASIISPAPTITRSTVALKPRRKKTSDRWWRISDEKVKESKTSDVLSMQKEVYLLFYELVRGDEDV